MSSRCPRPAPSTRGQCRRADEHVAGLGRSPSVRAPSRAPRTLEQIGPRLCEWLFGARILRKKASCEIMLSRQPPREGVPHRLPVRRAYCVGLQRARAGVHAGSIHRASLWPRSARPACRERVAPRRVLGEPAKVWVVQRAVPQAGVYETGYRAVPEVPPCCAQTDINETNNGLGARRRDETLVRGPLDATSAGAM